MIQTWDWLFLYLPRDEEKQRMVLENMESRKYTEIKVRDFVKEFLVTKDWKLIDESKMELLQ